MKLAVISDIHSNLEALRAVLADLEGAGVQEVVSLGDNLGYGPDPAAVLQLLRRRGIPSVMGNHELALLEPGYLNWFNHQARQALILNRRRLGPEDLAWVRGLPPYLVRWEVRLVHGLPPDSITSYLFETGGSRLARIMSQLPEPLCFVGHTHQLQWVCLQGRRVKRRSFTATPLELRPGWRYLVNSGSVGQPRDGDTRAKYVIYDQEAATVEARKVEYDFRRTAAKMRELGLPEVYARCLEGG